MPIRLTEGSGMTMTPFISQYRIEECSTECHNAQLDVSVHKQGRPSRDLPCVISAETGGLRPEDCALLCRRKMTFVNEWESWCGKPLANICHVKSRSLWCDALWCEK